jgi:hypothetical protein
MKKKIIITSFAFVFGIFVLCICFGYDKIQAWHNNKILWNETVKIMDEVFDMDIESWEFDYEYENTLERSAYEGDMRVWFKTTTEHAEEMLEKYKDIVEVDTELYSGDQLAVSRQLGVPEDTLNENGRTVFLYSAPVRELDLEGKPKTCFQMIHTQKNEDGTVTVLFDYLEG